MAVAATYSDESSMASCLSSLYSLEQEELFINDLLSDKSDSPRYAAACRVCDEGAAATSRCRDCDEALCDHCVRAHRRVRLTKDHRIRRLDDDDRRYDGNNTVDTYRKQSASVSPPGNRYFCDLHINEIVRLFCETCCAAVCAECVTKEHSGHSFTYFQDAVVNARKDGVKVLCDIRTTAEGAKENLDAANRMIEAVCHRANTVAREIRAVVGKFHLALEERERELLNRVERIRLFKEKALGQRAEDFRLALIRCGRSYDILNDALEAAPPCDLLRAKDQAVDELKNCRRLRPHPHEYDNVTFVYPENALFNAVATLGDVFSPGFPPTGLAVGEGLICPPAVCKDAVGFPPPLRKRFDDDPLSLDSIMAAVPTALDGDVEHRRRDAFFGDAAFRAAKAETGNRVPTTIRGKIPPPGPFGVNGRGRNYTEAGPVKLAFGREGDGDGELCRPWGVCCDKNGFVVVADRSNNRIQIFSPSGLFVRKFGRHGNEPGEFDRPAGVAVDPADRIVVADKDNHRIQIFTADGEFVRLFGEKGSKNGQFNYPWDVDVDAGGRIVVSDTRNHRIQLFAPDGTYLNKYGYENTSTMWKHFDSPRGVCFGFNGMVIVTDFNNHRLVLIDANFRNARFLGSEGSGAKEFLRPQGVAVDGRGHIVVADSRNHRVQVFESNGSFLWQFGESGKDVGRLDRPSGVCLSRDGQIVVVDFGNNRIQVF